MKFVTAFGMLLMMGGTSLADANAIRFKIENGKIVVAQSYCGICVINDSSCRLQCNGSGTCIQACDDQYIACRRQYFCH